MIAGLGTDVVAVARVERLLGTGPDTFVTRWFTEAEAGYCRAKAFPARHLAARLAAKESVAKALRLGQDRSAPWRDIEIVLDEYAAPQVRLHGDLRATTPAGGRWHVSLSHSDEYATAVAVLEVDEAPARMPVDPAPAATRPADPGDDPALGAAVTQSLREFERSAADRSADPALEAIRAAIMLEDVAGVVLREEQLDPTVLTDARAMARLVRELRAGL